MPSQRCPAPLSVVADPDIAGLVSELAGPLDDGSCPQTTIAAQESADVLAMLTGDGTQPPDVWIPASSLWLRLADSRGTGDTFGSKGTSIARTPVVMAVPTQLYEDRIKGPTVWPVWIVVYDSVIDGRIPRMSMPDPATSTEGALTMVALWDAMLFHSDGSSDGAAMRTINLRDHLAGTDADVDALLDALAGMASAADAGTQVGVFPATEQQLLDYNDQDPAVPVTLLGLYDAITEADYPMAVSAGVDGRRSDVVDRLRARLLSSEAAQRLVDAGFRPPRGAETRPAELGDTQRWPDYPDPIDLPDASGWNTLMQLWTLN